MKRLPLIRRNRKAEKREETDWDIIKAVQVGGQSNLIGVNTIFHGLQSFLLLLQNFHPLLAAFLFILEILLILFVIIFIYIFHVTSYLVKALSNAKNKVVSIW